MKERTFWWYAKTTEGCEYGDIGVTEEKMTTQLLWLEEYLAYGGYKIISIHKRPFRSRLK